MRFETPPATLRQLQYAAAVADTGSFRRAAELCHVSQPSLSAQLADLEGALGVRLFERGGRRGVLVTAAGEEVLVRARRALLEVEDLVEAARRFVDPLAGTLRVGIIPTVGPYLLPEVVPSLRKEFPKLTLAWVEDRTAALVADVAAGRLDAAIVALEADLGDLEREAIADDPFLLAAPPGHPLAKARGPARTRDLAGARVLLLDEGHCLREQALAVCRRGRAEELDFRATSLPTLAQMVASGAGVTLLPRLALATENRRADLAVRPFADPAPSRTIGLAWRSTTPLAPALRQVAGGHPPRVAAARVIAGRRSGRASLAPRAQSRRRGRRHRPKAARALSIPGS